MKNSQYIELKKIINSYRSTCLDISSKASTQLNEALFEDILELYKQLEVSKKDLNSLYNML